MVGTVDYRLKKTVKTPDNKTKKPWGKIALPHLQFRIADRMM